MVEHGLLVLARGPAEVAEEAAARHHLITINRYYQCSEVILSSPSMVHVGQVITYLGDDMSILEYFGVSFFCW